MNWLKIKKIIKRNWYPIVYKWIYFPVILSSLKPYVFESLAIWFPQINDMKSLLSNVPLVNELSEEVIQWITYFIIMFIYNTITFSIGKSNAVSDISKYRNENLTFRSLTYNPKTLIFLFIIGVIFYMLFSIIQSCLPRDPVLLIISALTYGYAQYKCFKGKK